MASTSSATGETLLELGRELGGSARALWHKSAPKAVRRAFSSDDSSLGWAAWKKHLARREVPADPAKLMPGGGESLGWGLPDGINSPPRPVWLDQLNTKRPRPSEMTLDEELLDWLGESAGGAPSAEHALEVLACARAIARLPAVLSPEVWWTVLDHLLGVTTDAGAIELDADPLVHQLLAGELGLTLAYLLPEISPCRKLRSAARSALSRGPIELLDGEGLPHGKHLALLRPLLACWTRCWALSARHRGGGTCFTAAAANQYEWLVRQALRLARHDTAHVFSNGSAARWDADLFAAALQFGGDDDDHTIAALVLPRRKGAGKSDARTARLPKAAVHSEWASTAVLRPTWSRSSQRLTVVYVDGKVRMELGCGKDVLLCGEWGLDVRLDGKAAVPVSEWEEVCWISDDDVDFLELEIKLDGDLTVQRQMVLAREDRFLLLADAVLAKESGSLEYRGTLPLGPDVAFEGAEQSREGYLVGGKRRALVLPLALPEWRSISRQYDRQVGELSPRAAGLQLSQSADGRCLYAPMFLDLDRRRQTRRVTWRQVTVAESLQAQPVDVAAGYRVAIGGSQWLIYRSLAEKANRTLLGHNLSTEMLVARFDTSGEVEPLIEIE